MCRKLQGSRALSSWSRYTSMLRKSCVIALCMGGCDMMKREAVCTALGSTYDDLRREIDAARESDYAPEQSTRAAAALRASAATLDPAAGTPVVDDYKDTLLRLAEYHERRARGEGASSVEDLGLTDYMDFREKAVAFVQWCRG
jgi:hypothetical protein